MSVLPAQPVVTSTSPDSIYNTPCRICRRQFSKYTCPKCNIPYCSLTCFRSSPHDQCSEAFYREEIQSDIKTVSSSTTAERLQMMELLKKFEESGLEDEEQDLDNYDFAERIGSTDLDSVSTEDLWEMLSPEQRSKFMKAVQAPESELAQQLLASEELDRDRREPWWNDTEFDNPNRLRPKRMIIPSTLFKAPPMDGPSLLYNICAICISYAYVNRYFATSPLSTAGEDDVQAMGQTLSQLVPFLVDRKSTTVFPNLSSVVTDIWSRLQQDNITPKFFSILLRDTSVLIRPHPVTEVPLESVGNTTDGAPHLHHESSTVLALSDIAALFQRIKPSTKPNPVSHKLTFYGAYLASIPPSIINILVNEITERSRLVENEALPLTNNAHRVAATQKVMIQEV